MRTTVVYVLLVGAPLLGLLGILQAGERLVPPRAVGGDWLLDHAPDGAPACLESSPDGEPVTLHIAQSGTRAELTLRAGARRVGLAARIAGDSLYAAAQAGRGRSACSGMALHARMDGDSTVRQLVGSIRAGVCPACSAHAFVARRALPTEE